MNEDQGKKRLLKLPDLVELKEGGVGCHEARRCTHSPVSGSWTCLGVQSFGSSSFITPS